LNHREKQEALATINRKLNEANKLMDDCVMLAEHAGVCFELPWGGEGTGQRGMGAAYVPENASKEEKECYGNRNWGDFYSGWQPSAGTC
jgi:hypothetical protein